MEEESKTAGDVEEDIIYDTPEEEEAAIIAKAEKDFPASKLPKPPSKKVLAELDKLAQSEKPEDEKKYNELMKKTFPGWTEEFTDEPSPNDKTIIFPDPDPELR